MNSQSIINILVVALLIIVTKVVVVTLWNSVRVPTLSATVSWNG